MKHSDPIETFDQEHRKRLKTIEVLIGIELGVILSIFIDPMIVAIVAPFLYVVFLFFSR